MSADSSPVEVLAFSVKATTRKLNRIPESKLLRSMGSTTSHKEGFATTAEGAKDI